MVGVRLSKLLDEYVVAAIKQKFLPVDFDATVGECDAWLALFSDWKTTYTYTDQPGQDFSKWLEQQLKERTNEQGSDR